MSAVGTGLFIGLPCLVSCGTGQDLHSTVIFTSDSVDSPFWTLDWRWQTWTSLKYFADPSYIIRNFNVVCHIATLILCPAYNLLLLVHVWWSNLKFLETGLGSVRGLLLGFVWVNAGPLLGCLAIAQVGSRGIVSVASKQVYSWGGRLMRVQKFC